MMAEMWLAEAGLFPATMADNLYAWARMQSGIAEARLEVSVGVDEKKPFVKFVLVPKYWQAYVLQEKLKAKGGIISKVLLIILSKLGAPVFAGEILTAMAKRYLPKTYDVRYEYSRQ
jgi:hypothetical protein